MTDRVPNSLEVVLRNLHQVKNVLGRGNIVEASHYIDEAKVKVRTEIDWTLDSDPDLPAILDFLDALTEGLSVAVQLEPSCRASFLATIIEEIELVTRKVSGVTKDLDAHRAPNGQLDHIEKQQLIRKYTTPD